MNNLVMETIREDQELGVRIRLYDHDFWVETLEADGWYHVAGPFNEMSDDFSYTRTFKRYEFERDRKRRNKNG